MALTFLYVMAVTFLYVFNITLQYVMNEWLKMFKFFSISIGNKCNI